MEQTIVYPKIKIGDLEFPRGISFAVVDGMKFLEDNFKFNSKEMIELYERTSARLKELIKENKYDMTYKNDDHFNQEGGFVIMAKIKKVDNNEFTATWQFNLYNKDNMVTLTIISEPNKGEKDFIMIGF